MSYPSLLGPVPIEGRPGANSSQRFWIDAANPELKKANQPEIYYYFPHHPRLVENGKSQPILSLILVLNRQPTPQDDTILPLIQQGIVNFEITFAPTDSERPKDTATIVYRPLFTREVNFALISDRDAMLVTLATATASSPPARAAINATLTREETLTFLSTLDKASLNLTRPLRVQSHVTYRVAATTQTLRLFGAWTAVYDFLKSRLSASGTLSLADLSQYFSQLLQEEIIGVFAIVGQGKEERVVRPDSALLFSRFLKLASVILKAELSDFITETPDPRYRLRGRPHPMFQLDYQQAYTHAGQTTLELTTDLSEILGGVLDGFDRSLFIQIVAPSTSSHTSRRQIMGLTEVPRRLKTSATQPNQSGSLRQSVELAAIEGRLQSIPQTLQPSATAVLNVQVLEASSAIQVPSKNLAGNLATTERVKQWWVDNMIVARPDHWPNGLKVKNLPIIQDPNAALWVDRRNSSQYWYAPSFAVVSPSPTEDPALSPFLFTFERTGTTQTGQPALTGQVRITLQQQIGDRTQAALKVHGNPIAHPVPLFNVAILMSIPFIDSKDGKLKRNLFTAVVQQSGNQIIANVELLNEWVRLCYGALGSPGFQRESVQVLVSYTYQGYVPFRMEEVEIAYGGKLAITPVLYAQDDALQMKQQPYLDVINLTYQHPQASIRLRKEARIDLSTDSIDRIKRSEELLSRSGFASARPTLIDGMQKVRPIETDLIRIKPPLLQITPIATPIVARPQLEASLELQKILVREQYAQQSLMRQESRDILFPCQQFGSFYREQIAETSLAIGCRDAFQLGQTAYRQYEKIEELTHPAYTIYRSLQQPGRFLIVPTHYRITRYESTEGSKAYRPCIIVYLQIDAAVAANNRVVFQTMVQPDLSPYVRQNLVDSLRPYARDPILEYPTDIVSKMVYTWAAIDQVVPSAVLSPNGFRVVLDTDLVHAQVVQNMLQRSGFYGSVRIELPDGLMLQSNLSLELSTITGPWSGPFSTAIVGGNQINLTNNIERSIALSDLLLYSGAVRASSPMPVETLLSPGASVSFKLDQACDRVIPVYAVAPGTATLEEVRSYVEDIHTNVAFVDLVNYDNHNLQRLEILTQLSGVVGTYRVLMDGVSRIGTMDLVLPLTVYLANRMLQFKVTQIFKTGEQQVTPWMNWDLTLQGNIVSLTWEMLQFA